VKSLFLSLTLVHLLSVVNPSRMENEKNVAAVITYVTEATAVCAFFTVVQALLEDFFD
jgi:hypothetical protein